LHYKISRDENILYDILKWLIMANKKSQKSQKSQNKIYYEKDLGDFLLA
jgi:hypothetical protein